jgi:hypothetical protein
MLQKSIWISYSVCLATTFSNFDLALIKLFAFKTTLTKFCNLKNLERIPYEGLFLPSWPTLYEFK